MTATCEDALGAAAQGLHDSFAAALTDSCGAGGAPADAGALRLGLGLGRGRGWSAALL